jgi:hypothetical protein
LSSIVANGNTLDLHLRLLNGFAAERAMGPVLPCQRLATFRPALHDYSAAEKKIRLLANFDFLKAFGLKQSLSVSV